MLRIRISLFAAIAIVGAALASPAGAQPFGVEMQNNMLPVAGAMGGASIARPQELLAGLNANPATLSNFGGTQFEFGGGWAEASFDLTQTGTLQVPGVTPFSAKSGTPGVAVANIGMSRQIDLFGVDSTMAFGLISNAGAGVDFRSVPASNRASSSMLVLEISSGFGMKLTDRLSVGTTVSLGSGYFNGPFVGNSAMVQAYGLRASLGANYELTDATSLGAYWQTKQHFHFDDAIGLQLFNNTIDITRDIEMDLPSTLGFGIANRRLLDGRLLVAMDVVYKNWERADLFESVYRDQWAFQFGTQYSYNRLRLRAGYVYAMNPIKPVTVSTAGGVTLPGATAGVEYLQSQFALINQNRLSAGIGIVDLRPGLDVDLFAGGMPTESGSTGQFTSVRVASYWIGLGMTYRFGLNGVTAK
jgi:long-chain fatty acid transport protein